MKVCAIQPPYPYTPVTADATVQFLVDSLDACTDDLDLILLPEYSNAPTNFPMGESIPYAQAHTEALIGAARRAAVRCQAIVAVCHACEVSPGVFRNTTRVYDRRGEAVGDYYKQQLVKSEVTVKKMDNSYVWQTNAPAIVEVDGLRLGFLICYDCYFTEFIAHLASLHPDIVLISSHQRGERHDVLQNQVCSIAFNCNAFVVRASVSMGKDSELGGSSMIASPDGKILSEFSQQTGMLTADIGDPHYKYLRSNAFGGALIRNDAFIEQGRTPWAYRPAGASVIPDDDQLPYPRICAHRGFNTVAPENSMPAFGAAIALGATEIEFDIWKTTDGELVLCHDANLERVSNGQGKVADKTLAELQTLDFGSCYGPRFAGLRVQRFEDVLKKFQRQCIINLHLKPSGSEDFNRELILQTAALIRQYDMTKHVYYMTGSCELMDAARKYAPDIHRCMGAGQDAWKIVEYAIELECQKVQLFTPYYSQAMINKAHDHGIRCNFFYSDDPEEAKKLLAMGVDTILTNDYLTISQAVNVK